MNVLYWVGKGVLQQLIGRSLWSKPVQYEGDCITTVPRSINSIGKSEGCCNALVIPDNSVYDSAHLMKSNVSGEKAQV